MDQRDSSSDDEENPQSQAATDAKSKTKSKSMPWWMLRCSLEQFDLTFLQTVNTPLFLLSKLTVTFSSTTKDNPALMRLNNLQVMERKTWKGVYAESTGIPGTCTLLNKKRFFPMHEH